MPDRAPEGTASPPAHPDFVLRPMHRAWLLEQARGLFGFFQPAAINPAGGFYALDDSGQPLPPQGPRGQVRNLHEATRMVHCLRWRI